MCMYIQNMHDRLAELNQPVPDPRISHKSTLAEEEEVDSSMVMGEEQDMMPDQSGLLEPIHPDFDFRLSMLPIWARKVALSRPSVAQQAGSKSIMGSAHVTSVSSRMAEGRWKEVL